MLARAEWFADPGTIARTKLAKANGIARLLSSPRFAGTAIGAITLGKTIYFRDPDLYDPHTPRGLAFLAHEIKHVEQYERHKLVGFYFKYLKDYFRGGYSRGIEFEDEAYGFQPKVQEHLETEFDDNPGLEVCQEMGEPHTPNPAFVRTVPTVFHFPPPPDDNE
jgi:hypothetical protein